MKSPRPRTVPPSRGLAPLPPAGPDPRRRALVWAAVGGTVSVSPCFAQTPGASIVAPLLGGGTFSTEAVKGRVLFVNFWATWCAPCRAEMPEIEAYYQAHRSAGLEVLALSVDELADEAKVREAAKPFGFPVAMMKASRLSGFGRIWRMPVSAVFDREGRLVKQDWFIQPKLDAAALDAVIKPLL